MALYKKDSWRSKVAHGVAATSMLVAGAGNNSHANPVEPNAPPSKAANADKDEINNLIKTIKTNLEYRNHTVSKEEIKKLIARLGSNDPETRDKASAEFAKMEFAAKPELEKLLNSTDPDIRN